MTLNLIGSLLQLLIIACVIGIIATVMTMLGRFIRCQERTASALETIARQLQDKRARHE